MAFLAGGASNIGEIHLEYNQPNQDSYCINTDKNIYAVFDGHGDNGHVISSYLKQNLASTFSDSLSLHPTQPVEDSLRNAFRKMNESICSSSQSESSGSTCAMAYVSNDLLYTAAVGDCSAMLVQADPSGTNIRTTALLPLHKLTNTSEFARIAKTGAQVTGEYVISLSDPNKVINMTRAFGDQDMQSAGIIARPQISITKICPKKANAPSQNGNPVLKVVFNDGEPRNNDNNSSSENSNSDESDSNGKEHPPRVPHYRDLCDDDSEESGGDSANELIIDKKRKMDDNITNDNTNNNTNNTNDNAVNNTPNNTSDGDNNNIADNTNNNTTDNACSNSNNTSYTNNTSDDANNNNNTNTNNDTNSTKAETLKEDVKYIDSTIIDGADKDWDTFLVLSSDGLEQVEVDEIARKAHRLIKTQIAGGTTPLEINTTCSKLLQTLEDSIYEKDGIGFNDDATVILVLLSGFLPSST